MALRRVAVWVALAIGLSPSCAWLQRVNEKQLAKTKQASLERVAKGWCQTIRASQVIPVYPLTEDLQPGDVFLVTLPIEEQHEEYVEKGFLALDNHLVRLDPSGYDAFYDTSFRQPNGGPTTQLPGTWSRPGGTGEADKAWSQAPHAAFPSYSFSIRGGSGFNLALPVSGVPVGLSLLGTNSAAGTITIADCRTVGVDILSLWDDLATWRHGAADRLAPYASRRDRQHYLRVVTRVYLTGRLDVALADTSSVAAGLDAGAPRPVDLLLPETAEEAQSGAVARENYTSGIEQINAMLAAQSAPGGSVRLNSASARSVALSDTFDPPLVIGYLGFDCEILPGGELSQPVPTLVTLNRDPAFVERLFGGTPEASLHSIKMFEGLRSLIADTLEEDRESGGTLLSDARRSHGQRVLERFDALVAEVDRARSVYEPVPAQGALEVRQVPFGDSGPQSGDASEFLRYRAALRSSLDLLTRELAEPEFVLREGELAVTVRPLEEDDRVAARLRAERDDLEALLAHPPWAKAEAEARRDALAWLDAVAR